MCATEAVERESRAALAALAAEWQVPCDASQIDALIEYGELLLRWNARINLTGASSVAVLLESHFPDAFALARWLDTPARLVDVGSGGGLPALPLALLRPALDVRLCEPIAKKAAFLRTAIRESGLAGRVRLDARRGEEIAAGGDRFDAALSRATFAPEVWLALGRKLVRPGGRVFVLTTPSAGPGGQGETPSGKAWDPGHIGRRQDYAGGRRVVVEVTT